MISFFAESSYIGNFYHMPDSNARRLSSRIRAEEMAAYLGAKLNPTEGFENDVRIFVKPKAYAPLIRDGDWIDFLDGDGTQEGIVAKHPKAKLIAASKTSYEDLKSRFPNEVVFIPSHHINQERFRRDRKEISVAGYVGGPSPDAVSLYEGLASELKKVGFDFKTCFYYKTREDAVNFYRSIDLFVIGPWIGRDFPHRIPTKPINAASFGIPTIAHPIMGYEEIEGYYVPARTIEEILTEAVRFKDLAYYQEWSDKVAAFAENYHISKVAPLYQKLT